MQISREVLAIGFYELLYLIYVLFNPATTKIVTRQRSFLYIDVVITIVIVLIVIRNVKFTC